MVQPCRAQLAAGRFQGMEKLAQGHGIVHIGGLAGLRQQLGRVGEEHAHQLIDLVLADQAVQQLQLALIEFGRWRRGHLVLQRHGQGGQVHRFVVCVVLLLAPRPGLLQGASQLLEHHGLGQVVVHAGLQAGLAGLGQRMGAEADHVGLVGHRALTQGTRGVHAVHLGHLHVHQHRVVVNTGRGLHGLQAIGDHIGGIAQFVQQQADHALVDQVVLGHQQAQRAALGQRRFVEQGGGRGILADQGAQQRVVQQVLLDGLGDHGLETRLRARHGGRAQQDQRQLLRGGHRADRTGQLHAVDFGHLVVQQGHVEFGAPRQQLQRLQAAGTGARLHAPRGQRLRQDAGAAGVVVHQQHAFAVQR